ncbi:MAG: oligoendopeptidase F [Spirochaetes bacterium]|nr:oligoendopeptidase F [Spirochaetota bacterium]
MAEQRVPDRNEIDDSSKWDLSPLFSNDDDWESLFVELENKSAGYAAFRGTLHESAETLRRAIDFDLDVSRGMDRLFTYAHLRSDEDKANQRYLGLYQRGVSLYTRMSELSSFMGPEIQSIDNESMARFLKDPALGGYRFYLERILRDKPHTLPGEIEEILAMGGEIAMAPSQIFGQLDNADLRFGTILDEKGRERELSHGNFSSFLMSRSREVRETAFFRYYRSYDAMKNTIAAALSHSVKKDLFYSRVRKFGSCREAALFSDNVPGAVYDSLLSAVRANLSPLFRYLDLRKRVLGLEELHFYDTYVPIVGSVDFSMSYEEAAETCVDALAVLGDEYTTVLKEGLSRGWVDRYENRGKRSGAYSSGCYDSPPYILMNYRDDTINSIYTLIHEAGHSMHSYFSNRMQPFIYHGYSIFVAEVASTCNELLLTHHLLERYAGDRLMTAYILNREIDDIRATLYRQTMFAEFEDAVHSAAERGEPLTLDALRGAYRGLLGDYFGSSMVIDEELSLECLRIPHFYSPFYVYKYATGISAAIALSQAVLQGGEDDRRRYLDFLSMGGSRYPLDELDAAGVDMRSPEPVTRALQYFDGLVRRMIDSAGSL